jgi:hypothetical protein
MKIFLSILTATVIISGAFLMVSFSSKKADQVRHVVVFKYKPEATEAQIQKITNAFRDLQNKIPGIVAFETGVNNSPENLNQGFTHVYMLTFKDAAARDAYLPHPEHKEFGNILRSSGIFDGAFVVDYVPEK